MRLREPFLILMMKLRDDEHRDLKPSQHWHNHPQLGEWCLRHGQRRCGSDPCTRWGSQRRTHLHRLKQSPCNRCCASPQCHLGIQQTCEQFHEIHGMRRHRHGVEVARPSWQSDDQSSCSLRESRQQFHSHKDDLIHRPS